MLYLYVVLTCCIYNVVFICYIYMLYLYVVFICCIYMLYLYVIYVTASNKPRSIYIPNTC